MLLDNLILSSAECLLFLATFSVILQPLCAMFTISIPVSIFLTQFNAKTKIFNILYVIYYFMIFTFIYRVIFVQEIYILLKILLFNLYG